MFRRIFFSIAFLASFSQISSAKECSRVFHIKAEKIELSQSVVNNQNLAFIAHSNALAMNIQYEPILKLRQDIQKLIKLRESLKFLTTWGADGEAHVTVITPPEAVKLLSDNEKYISQSRIDQIAKDFKIQASDLKILGLGSGKKLIDGCEEQTFYLVVKSKNLLDIRRRIYKEFMSRGGNANDFDPDHFFPHVTIGYTLRDLHESDGIIKDINSLDTRFELIFKN